MVHSRSYHTSCRKGEPTPPLLPLSGRHATTVPHQIRSASGAYVVGLPIGKTECRASYIWVQISTEIHKVTLMKCQRHWPRARQLLVVGQQQLPCQSRHSIPLFGSSNYKYYAAHRQQKIVQGLHNILDVRVSIYLPYCFSQSFSLFAFMCTYSGFSLTMILPSLE